MRPVCKYLDEIFQGRVIDRYGLTEMSTKSPDLISMDYFFGVVRKKTHSTKPKQ